ncbi:hypothetical protein Pmani_035861, partial [Petrolisthes manimaculis]
PATFTGATNLVEVAITDTLIDTFPAATFSGLNSLEKVTLSGGKITTLPANSFTSTALTSVDLSANAITNVELNALVVQPQTEINLASNQLTTLPSEVFQPLVTTLTDGGYIDVNDNPLTCGCDLEWIVNIGPTVALSGLDSACDLHGYSTQEILDFLEYQCSNPPPPPPEPLKQ